MTEVTAPEAGRRVLVLGGARSGKSEFAESLLAGHAAVTYVATSTADGADPDWERRIAAHRGRRPAGWRTVEGPDLAATLADAQGAVLVDSLTAWLTGVLDQVRAWDRPAGTPAPVTDSVERLMTAWRATRATAVAVSDEVGLGVVPATPAGRLFRDELGALNQRMAATADAVWFVVAGVPMRLR
jgi:adenosylcobinamide kinase/adenosylcobinamide-phosphate guanylyltransferase